MVAYWDPSISHGYKKHNCCHYLAIYVSWLLICWRYATGPLNWGTIAFWNFWLKNLLSLQCTIIFFSTWPTKFQHYQIESNHCAIVHMLLWMNKKTVLLNVPHPNTCHTEEIWKSTHWYHWKFHGRFVHIERRLLCGQGLHSSHITCTGCTCTNILEYVSLWRHCFVVQNKLFQRREFKSLLHVYWSESLFSNLNF